MSKGFKHLPHQEGAEGGEEGAEGAEGEAAMLEGARIFVPLSDAYVRFPARRVL